jgi:hypothetical protein
MGHTVASAANDTANNLSGQNRWNGYSRFGRPRYLDEPVLQDATIVEVHKLFGDLVQLPRLGRISLVR